MQDEAGGKGLYSVRAVNCLQASWSISKFLFIKVGLATRTLMTGLSRTPSILGDYICLAAFFDLPESVFPVCAIVKSSVS